MENRNVSPGKKNNTQERAENGEMRKKSSAPKGSPVSGSGRSHAARAGRVIGGIFASIGRLIVILLSVVIIILSVSAIMLSLYVVNVTAEDSSMLNLNNLKLSYSSTIYAYNSTTGDYEPYQRLVDTADRIWVDGSNIPDLLKKAFISIEDKTFYDNNGVNYRRTFSVTVNYMLNKLSGGRIKLYSTEQGASTITQQLVKNITGDDNTDWLRKVREIFRAISLNNNYSKDQILEAYLNTVSFTGNICGVQACSYNLFDKDVSKLTLAECATIAAITNNPTYYNPRTQPEHNLQRRNLILDTMLEEGYISQSAHDAAVKESLNLVDEANRVNTAQVGNYSYFTDTVIDEVLKDLVSQGVCETAADATKLLYNGGLAIYATIDTSIQTNMETMFENEPGNIYPSRPVTYTDSTTGQEVTQDVQGAMIVIDYSGAVKGVVGGLGAKTADRSLNRATSSYRQTGSTMKPLGAYVLGIEDNIITYSDSFMDDYFKIINDEQTGQPIKWPSNYSKSYTEKGMLVSDAIANSINTIAVRVGNLVGVNEMFDFMTNVLEISSLVDSDKDLAPLVLGSMTYGVSPKDMAHAYMMFGDGGTLSPVHSYSTVEVLQTGKILLDNTSLPTTRAISTQTAYIMNRLLREVVTRGTASYVGGPTAAGLESIGKTGTTSDDKDHWFIGLTPYYVTATWMGYDYPLTLEWRGQDYDKHPPTVAWVNLMNEIEANLEYKEFPTSDGVVAMQYCRDSGGIATASCPNTATGYYKQDNIPAACTVDHSTSTSN